MLTTNPSNEGHALVGTPIEGDLVLAPVAAESIALNPAVSTVVRIDAATNAYRAPIVRTDPAAQWVAEGQEITPTDPDLDELTIVVRKIAGLTIISRELANDSNPAAHQTVGAGLARDIARKIDTAFFGTTTANAPDGIAKLEGVAAVTTTQDAWTNIDPFVTAIGTAETVGATLSAFVANPADALAIAMLKKSTGSNEPLLQPDPTQPTRRTIQGVPLLVTPAVAQGTIWGLDRTRNIIALREDVDIEADGSVYFTSDRIAVRAICRLGWGFTHPAAVVKITHS